MGPPNPGPDGGGDRGCCCGPFRIRFIPPGLVRPTLLRLLSQGERTGFQLMKEISQRTRGTWAPGPAAVYPALRELESRGFVERAPPGKGRARPYRLTRAGQACIRDWEEVRARGGRELAVLSELWRIL